MTRSSTPSRRSLQSLPAAARAARSLPWGWRLWGGAFAATMLMHHRPGVVPFVALAGFLAAWHSLHRYASTFSEHKPSDWRRNALAFLAGLLAALAYSAASLFLLDWRLQSAGYGLPALILIASGMGVAIAYGIVRQWWKGGYTLLAGLASLTVGSLSIWAATAQTLPSEAATSSESAFFRIMALFFVAGVVEATHRGVRTGRIHSMRWLSGIAESAVFAIILSAAIPLNHANASWANARGVALTAMLAAMLATCLYRARFPVLRDLKWLRSAWSGDRVDGGRIPFGMWTGFAFTPALLLVPLADTPTWLACSGLTVVALFLRRLSLRPRRPDPKPAPKRIDSAPRQPELVAV